MTEIVNKIRKLHAQAEGAKEIGSMAEAEAFAKKVKELMDRHKIDMSQIEFNDYDEEDVENMVVFWSEYGHKDLKRKEMWTSQLAVTVAMYCNCRVLTRIGSNMVSVWGRKTDLDVVSYTLQTLTPICLKLCKRAYHEIYWEVRPLEPYERKAILKGFRASWKIGFIQGVQRGLEEAEKKIAETADSTALIRVSGMMEKVDDYLATNMKLKKSKRSRYQHNSRGFNEGFDTGKAVGGRSRLEG